MFLKWKIFTRHPSVFEMIRLALFKFHSSHSMHFTASSYFDNPFSTRTSPDLNFWLFFPCLSGSEGCLPSYQLFLPFLIPLLAHLALTVAFVRTSPTFFCRIKWHSVYCRRNQIIWRQRNRLQRILKNVLQPCTSYLFYNRPCGYWVY